MQMLYIKCPKTGKDLPTGISMPEGADLSGLKDNTTICPHCPENHTWDGKDAFCRE